MSYDLFISYSRRDNERGQVAQLIAQIEASFSAFAGREIRFFFDTQAIQGMDDWRQKIQRSLRESRLFLAVLSPNYIASPYCRWEWEDYVRYEAMRQCLGEGVAPVFFIALPGGNAPQADAGIAHWLDEINQRQTFDLRPWHDHGEKALQEVHVRATLERLHASVRERLDRAERARLSPNNLIKHNAAFVGRVRELTDLRNALTHNKLGVVGARQGKAIGPVAVQGLGGMGKTELALAYAHAFAWDYPGGRWQIPCEYTADLRLALSRLGGPMGFAFTEDESKDLALQFERILREIEHRERCLLILDNVSDPHLLEPEYLDRLPRDGHVDLVATTRLAPASIPGSAQDLTFIAVDELPEEDALALMRSHQPEGRFAGQDEESEARLIVRLLRGFTLAVETAAIYLGRHPAPDACRQFRQRLSPALLRESEQAASDPAVAVRHRVRSLDETLAFTLATLTPEAMHLLTFAGLLPADQVAVPWLRVLGSARYPTFQQTRSDAFSQPLDLLLGLRLFQPGETVDVGGHLLIVRVHRLVQDLVRQKTSADGLATMQQAVDELILERDAALEKTTVWTTARWELEPLTALAGLWDEMNHPRAAWLLNLLGQRWHALAEWNQCEPLMRRALAIDESSHGPGHPDVATSLNNLAGLLQATNRLAEAEKLHHRALAIWEKAYGSDHPHVARALINFAGLLQATDRLMEAEPLKRRGLAIMEKAYGPDHPEVATALNNLAQLLKATNRLAEAEKLHHRALAIDEASHGPDHSKVATDLNNLAGLLQDANRLAEAEPLMRRALAIDEACYGADHPDVATDLNNLALLLKTTNRLAEAEPLMRRALAIDEACYGADHPDVATDLNNLALLLKTTNRLAEAEPLYRRALAIDEASYGSDNHEVARDLNNLVGLLQDTDRLAEAEPLMRRVVIIFEKAYGPDHPNVAVALDNLAQLLQDTDRLAEAEPLYRRALAIGEASYGPDHPHVATTLNNLAGLLKHTNRLAEAEPLMRRALAIDEASYGPDHPKVAIRLNNLARLLQATNCLAEAEPLYRRALAIDEASYGPDHPKVAIRLNNLAGVLQATNRLTEAEPLMLRALAIDEASYGPDLPSVARDLNNIAALLKATNRLAEAEPLMRRVVIIFEEAYGPDHPNVAVALNNLARLLQATNRLAEAESLMLRALAIDEYSCGPDHPDVAADLNNLAGLLQAANRRAEAESLYRRVLAIWEKAYVPDHPNVASALNILALAQLLQATNRLAEAEPLMRRALAILMQFTRATGHAHPHLKTAVNNYAGLLDAMGRSEDQILAALSGIAPEFFPL